jgi:hypothetical protein
MGEKRARKLQKRKHREKSKIDKAGKRAQRPQHYKIYIDESGNSGNNIFDKDQPTFFSLGILSRHDLKTIEECSLAREKLQVDELHGNNLGLTKISDISSLLIEVVQRCNLLFLCSEIDKTYYGKMKFFDVIFDSGTNPGVGSHHCFIKPLKLLLMIRFAELVTFGELEHFWTAYSKKDASSFKSLMENMIERVNDYETDERTREIMLDCYKGAVLAPADVLGYGIVKGDSPNVSTIVMFIHELHRMFDGRNILINEVIHDTQEQFGVSIEESYRILHQVRIIWNIADFRHKQVKVFSPNFYVCDSKECDGLQLCDIFLYLHKKARHNTLKGEARTLYRMFLSRLHCLFMTKEGLWCETELELREVHSKPLTTADYERGAKLLKELESKRKTTLLKGSCRQTNGLDVTRDNAGRKAIR